MGAGARRGHGDNRRRRSAMDHESARDQGRWRDRDREGNGQNQFLVTGGPERVEDGLDAPAEADAAADANDAGEEQGD